MSDEKKETIHLIVSDEENPKIEHKHGAAVHEITLRRGRGLRVAMQVDR